MRTVFLLVVLFTFFSCERIDLFDREGKDLVLNKSTFKNLDVLINSTSTNSVFLSSVVFNQNDFSYYDSLRVKSLKEDTLDFLFYKKDSIHKQYNQFVQFKDGYIVLKNESKTSFKVGPLVWSNTNRDLYLGISKQKELVLIDYSGIAKFCLFFPYNKEEKQQEFIFKTI